MGLGQIGQANGLWHLDKFALSQRQRQRATARSARRAAGIMWAGYAAIMRSKRVPALTATALVAVGSAVLYLPIYVLALPKQIADVSLQTILLQAVFQGVLVTIIAIYAFSRSTELLGPIAGTSLPALSPAVTLGIEILVLGETPHLGSKRRGLVRLNPCPAERPFAVEGPHSAVRPFHHARSSGGADRAAPGRSNALRAGWPQRRF